MRDKNIPAADASPSPPPPKKQRGLIKYRRAGVLLTADEVREIKEGRKKLRRELREAGIKSRREFEMTASSLGLYFDKGHGASLLLWLFHGRVLWWLLGALLSLLTVLFLLSIVSKMRGHFTINMTDELFAEGFAVADAIDEEGELVGPTSYLFSGPVENVPCTSIAFLPDDLDMIDGSHNGVDHFAYTFYIRNEGKSTVGYEYQLRINSESLDISVAAWVMLFEDGEMTFYAKAGEDGHEQALPAFDDNTRGYRNPPYMDVAKYPDTQYQLIDAESKTKYYRLVPIAFESDLVVTSGRVSDVDPGETHKYTVVIWLEGDDPDCNNDIIGGHIGFEMGFQLVEENEK